jgi:hypothetical protein
VKPVLQERKGKMVQLVQLVQLVPQVLKERRVLLVLLVLLVLVVLLAPLVLAVQLVQLGQLARKVKLVLLVLLVQREKQVLLVLLVLLVQREKLVLLVQVQVTRAQWSLLPTLIMGACPARKDLWPWVEVPPVKAMLNFNPVCQLWTKTIRPLLDGKQLAMVEDVPVLTPSVAALINQITSYPKPPELINFYTQIIQFSILPH